MPNKTPKKNLLEETDALLERAAQFIRVVPLFAGTVVFHQVPQVYRFLSISILDDGFYLSYPDETPGERSTPFQRAHAERQNESFLDQGLHLPVSKAIEQDHGVEESPEWTFKVARFDVNNRRHIGIRMTPRVVDKVVDLSPAEYVGPYKEYVRKHGPTVKIELTRSFEVD
jgi:hypothetical protein